MNRLMIKRLVIGCILLTAAWAAYAAWSFMSSGFFGTQSDERLAAALMCIFHLLSIPFFITMVHMARQRRHRGWKIASWILLGYSLACITIFGPAALREWVIAWSWTVNQ